MFQLQSSRLPKRVLFIGLLIALNGLIGCASHVNMLPNLSQENVSSDKGIVVARIINASSYSLPLNYLTIVPENLNESDDVKLDRLSATQGTGLSGSTVFASVATPGNYAIGSIRAYHTRGEYWYSRFVNADPKFGTFTVTAGQVTDLGTIIYYQRPEGDKYYDTLVRLPIGDTSEVIDNHYAFYQYDPTQTGTWHEDDRDAEREDLFASIAQNPTNYSKRYLAPDGSIYFLTKLGVIIKRSANGDWSLEAVDTNLELLDIAQNDQGDLIVGGTAGSLFLKRANDEQWQDISLNYDQHIKKLIFNTQQHIDMVVQTRSNLSILRAEINIDELQWQILNDYSYLSNWQNKSFEPTPKNSATAKQARSIRGFSTLAVDDKHYITVYTTRQNDHSIFSSSKKETYLYDPSTWLMHSKASQPEFRNIIDAGATRLAIKQPGFWSWSGRTQYFRYDDTNKNWQPISTYVFKCPDGTTSVDRSCPSNDSTIPVTAKKSNFYFIAIPWFKNNLEAIAAVNFSNTNYWTGQTSNQQKLLHTTDGGVTWTDTKRELPRKFCSGIVPELADQLLISCNGISGDFFESDDLAETWEHVRQHESF